jgi:hypothetical protein
MQRQHTATAPLATSTHLNPAQSTIQPQLEHPLWRIASLMISMAGGADEPQIRRLVAQTSHKYGGWWRRRATNTEAISRQLDKGQVMVVVAVMVVLLLVLVAAVAC